MRNAIDFASLQSLFTTLLGLALVSIVAVGIRLLVMQTVQRRKERENRQINERLKVLIAAYKTLGGAFTGDLTVDPAHLRDQRRAAEPSQPGSGGSERRRRMRDAVEAALSDVILLGTDEQVRLAVQAATDMVAGRPVETAALVVALRSFIREVLQLDAIPATLVIPGQGPLRTTAAGAGRAERTDRGDRGSAGGSGGGSRGDDGDHGGIGMGAGVGVGTQTDEHDGSRG